MTACGLLLDFSGVISTDYRQNFRGFCVRAGLAADAQEEALASLAVQ